MASREYKPGFQGSETTGAEITFYTQGNDPVRNLPPMKIECIGGNERSKNPSVESVQTNKLLGAPAGTMTAVLKQGGGEDALDLDDVIQDDDWFDIVFTRHGEPTHVMRGLVDNVAKSVSRDANGATTKTWTVSGTDFGKVWMRTSVFFNRYLGEDVGGGLTLKTFAGMNAIFGDPAKTVQAFLIGFLTTLQERGNASWTLPKDMVVNQPPESYLAEAPFVFSETFDPVNYFAKFVRFNQDGFSGVPERHAIGAHTIDFQNGVLWDLAQQWSDAQFCEMFVDLLDWATGALIDPEQSLAIDNTVMGVVFRDRPFPTSANGQAVQDSPWFKLPRTELIPQDITSKNVLRSGEERKNAFFAQPKYSAENANNQLDLSLPLWDKADIKRHGMRRMDFSSSYVAEADNLLGLTTIQRERMRDWFALNPYYYAGTLVLGRLFPNIRVGTRLRVAGASEDLDEEYYVEGVSHSYRWGDASSLVQVTRGWRGTKNSLIEAIEGLQDRYEVPFP